MTARARILAAARTLALPAATVALSGAAGWAYAAVFATGLHLVSTVYGVFFGVPLILYERGKLWPRLRARVRRASTPVFAAATLAIVVCTFVAGIALAGLVLWATGIMRTPLLDAAPTPLRLAYAFAAAALIVAVFRVRDLIGPRIFLSFLVGRYHRPIHEERVFLFLDLVGSTSFAERHGDLRAAEYLARAFEVLAGPVARYRGSVDDFVGDMALVTWRLDEGVRDAAVVRCVFAFLEEIERGAEGWHRRFGEVPRFRAALHCGQVVTAEIGVDHHKIAYFGDVVNTTARLEALAKVLGEPIVASSDLLKRIGFLPQEIAYVELGRQIVRGRDQPLDVTGLKRLGYRSGAAIPPR